MKKNTKSEKSSVGVKKPISKLKIFLIILGVLVLAAVVFAGMTGMVPGLSTVMGANNPRDLGVRYSEADYQSGSQKLGFQMDKGAGYGPNTKLVFSTTTKKVDAVLTNEEISALVSMHHSDKYPVKDAQVKINGDGTIESSAKVVLNNYRGVNFDNAVYVKATVDVTSPTSLKVNAQKVEAGRVAVPALDQVENAANQELNARLLRVPGLNIESVSIEGDGKLHVKGEIPESAKRVLK